MTGRVLQPTSIEEFRDAILAAGQAASTLHIQGGQSKIRVAEDASGISTQQYAGIVDHQASDFTITARSGTKLQEVNQTLLRAGQYLPFDPACVERGATVGGLIASGLHGPCRLRYGGIRDFVIGCQYIDGTGTVVRAGGKVVKNAAGFDLPKFFVGSGGRFGLLTEVTFKVFPQPKRYRTFRFPTTQWRDAFTLMTHLSGLLEFEAMEILSDNQVLTRVAGETVRVLDAATREIESTARHAHDVLDEDASLWTQLANLSDLAPDDSEATPIVVKIPCSLQRIEALHAAVSEQSSSRRFTAAGNACLVRLASITEADALGRQLQQMNLSAQMVLGPSTGYLLGAVQGLPLLERVKQAMDPLGIWGPLLPHEDAIS